MSREYELYDLAMLKLRHTDISSLSCKETYYKFRQIMSEMEEAENKYREENPGFDPGGNYLKPQF